MTIQRLLLTTALLASCKTADAPADAAAPGSDARTDSVVSVAPGAGDGGSPAIDALPADTGGASNTGGSGGCAQDLTGTWDLLATRPGSLPSGGVMTISKDGFSLSVAGNRLIYTAGPTMGAIWQGGGGPHPVAVQNMPSNVVETGSLPLVVGGDWIFKGGTEQCSMQVAPGRVTGVCQSSAGDPYVGGSDWPGAVPNLLNFRIYSATRSSVAASRFADLGGAWQAKAVGWTGQGCLVNLQGNTLVATCDVGENIRGVTVLTISDDCVASGKTEKFELSARRR